MGRVQYYKRALKSYGGGAAMIEHDVGAIGEAAHLRVPACLYVLRRGLLRGRPVLLRETTWSSFRTKVNFWSAQCVSQLPRPRV